MSNQAKGRVCQVMGPVVDVRFEDGSLPATSGWTNIFIYPGYTFKCIDALVTNFHLP